MSLLILLTILINCSSTTPKEPEPSPAVQKEVEVGRALAARLAKKYGLVQDKEFTIYLNKLGQSLAANSSRQELNFRFGVLNTNEINAFACPGGYILITLGSIKLMESESELASVLSHEISHVSLMHSGNFEGQDHNFLDILAAVMAPGGDLVSSLAHSAMNNLVDELLEKGRDKAQEIEADKAGILLASQLQYDLDSSISYLTKIQKDQENNKVLLKTHPPTQERIEAIKKFIADQKLASKGKTNPERFNNSLSRLTARLENKPEPELLQPSNSKKDTKER